LFDPHAIKIYVDGSCWKNPGGSGGFAARVEYGCDGGGEDGLVEYRGYVETNNNRMEMRGCIFAHQWTFDNDIRGRVIVVTDSKYVRDSYFWMLGWSKNDYCNDAGRPMKNDDLLGELMTLRRKLSGRVRIEVKRIPRRSDDGAKQVDTMAKVAGRKATDRDWGFPKGKIGRPKNNSKGAAKLYPAAGQTPFIRPYKSYRARRDIQVFRFEEWDDTKGIFLAKFEAYASDTVGDQLHRHNVYHVRMNDVPAYPQIVDILTVMKEKEFLALRAEVTTSA
jgi:ribonuclease HI